MSKENKSNRKKLTEAEINSAIYLLQKELAYRLNEKGAGTFSSRHEIQGCVTEEYTELLEALIGNNVEEYKKELLDVAVSCLFGIACIDAKTIDW